MKKIEDKIKELWSNETVRDFTYIAGVTAAEYVTENVLFRQMDPKYHSTARGIADIGSNTLSYYLGKSQGENSNNNPNNNQNSGQNNQNSNQSNQNTQNSSQNSQNSNQNNQNQGGMNQNGSP